MTKWNEETIRERVLEYVKVAEEYYKRDFTANLPKVLINENKRVCRNLGLCRWKKGTKQFETIEISRYCITKYTDELVDKVIGHEVAHYITLEVYKSPNHDAKFKKVCSVLSNIGVEVNGYAIEKGSENYIRESYEETKVKAKTREEKLNEFYKKKNDARYILKCKYCDCAGFYKVARKDSIKRWVLKYSCADRGHKDSLICYDTKENVKYEKVANKLKRSKMNADDKEICKKIVAKKY